MRESVYTGRSPLARARGPARSAPAQHQQRSLVSAQPQVKVTCALRRRRGARELGPARRPPDRPSPAFPHSIPVPPPAPAKRCFAGALHRGEG